MKFLIAYILGCMLVGSLFARRGSWLGLGLVFVASLGVVAGYFFIQRLW